MAKLARAFTRIPLSLIFRRQKAIDSADTSAATTQAIYDPLGKSKSIVEVNGKA